MSNRADRSVRHSEAQWSGGTVAQVKCDCFFLILGLRLVFFSATDGVHSAVTKPNVTYLYNLGLNYSILKSFLILCI